MFNVKDVLKHIVCRAMVVLLTERGVAIHNRHPAKQCWATYYASEMPMPCGAVRAVPVFVWSLFFGGSW